jgi:hypothetical protein
MLIAPLSAQALGVQIAGVSSSGGNASLLQDGDVLTVDLIVENASLQTISAMGLEARGYDKDADGKADDGLSLLGGTIGGPSVFNTQYLAAGINIDGLQNNLAGVEQRGNPIIPVPFQPAQELHAQFFEGVSIAGSSGNGTFDSGIPGGDQTLPGGAVHFQIQFVATAFGLVNANEITLQFGGSEDFGNGAVDSSGAIVAVSSDSYTVSVIPEPGTALLMGLGLAGLATTRRR